MRKTTTHLKQSRLSAGLIIKYKRPACGSRFLQMKQRKCSIWALHRVVGLSGSRKSLTLWSLQTPRICAYPPTRLQRLLLVHNLAKVYSFPFPSLSTRSAKFNLPPSSTTFKETEVAEVNSNAPSTTNVYHIQLRFEVPQLHEELTRLGPEFDLIVCVTFILCYLTSIIYVGM